jgi:hypothetical protein
MIQPIALRLGGFKPDFILSTMMPLKLGEDPISVTQAPGAAQQSASGRPATFRAIGLSHGAREL